MTMYLVEMKNSGREVYLVEADSPEQAAEEWWQGSLETSEVYDSEVVGVKELED